MREALVGLEIEYGLRCGLLSMTSIYGGYAPSCLSFIIKQVGAVLNESDYVMPLPGTAEFWTRGGMRCYEDRRTNIEVATAECATFADLIFQRNVGDRLVQALVDAARPLLAEHPHDYHGPLEAYANNTALDLAHPLPHEPGSEVTFSCHENYLLRRDLFPGKERSQQARYEHIWDQAGPFIVTRPLLGGSGHISPNGTFLLSPRSFWMKTAVGSGTTGGRTYVNTRDEPHANAEKFFRYHHIGGDTNITDQMLRMKIAFTYWVLRLVERGWTAPLWLKLPTSECLQVAREVNDDPMLTKVFQNGRKKFTAHDVLLTYLEAVDTRKCDLLFTEEDERIFQEVAAYLADAKKGWEALVGKSEWATKYMVTLREARKKNCESFNDFRLRMLSVAFHNLDRNPEQNPFIILRNQLLPPNIDVGDLRHACRVAPRTRAFVRGLAVYCANTFDIPISFPTGREWFSMNIPAKPGLPPSSFFDLNQLSPWDCSKGDIKKFIDRIRPWALKYRGKAYDNGAAGGENSTGEPPGIPGI